MNCKTPAICTVWTIILTFAINYSQFKCVQLFENIFIIISERQCFSIHTQTVNQTVFIGSSLVYSTVVTKLHLFIRIKT